MSGDQKDPLTPKSTLIKIDLTVTRRSGGESEFHILINENDI